MASAPIAQTAPSHGHTGTVSQAPTQHMSPFRAPQRGRTPLETNLSPPVPQPLADHNLAAHNGTNAAALESQRRLWRSPGPPSPSAATPNGGTPVKDHQTGPPVRVGSTILGEAGEHFSVTPSPTRRHRSSSPGHRTGRGLSSISPVRPGVAGSQRAVFTHTPSGAHFLPPSARVALGELGSSAPVAYNPSVTQQQNDYLNSLFMFTPPARVIGPFAPPQPENQDPHQGYDAAWGSPEMFSYQYQHAAGAQLPGERGGSPTQSIASLNYDIPVVPELYANTAPRDYLLTSPGTVPARSRAISTSSSNLAPPIGPGYSDMWQGPTRIPAEELVPATVTSAAPNAVRPTKALTPLPPEHVELAADQLTCPMCLRLFPSAPRLLDCGHTYCEACLTKELVHGMVVCPIDKHLTNVGEVPRLPLNTTVQAALRSLHTPATIPPPVCEKCELCVAPLFCEECDVYLCEGCNAEHHRGKLRSHPVSILGRTGTTLLPRAEPVRCTKAGHKNRRCELFDPVSKEALCYACLQQRPANEPTGKLMSLAEATTNLATGLSAWLTRTRGHQEKLRNLGAVLDTIIAEIETSSRNEALHVEERAAQLHQLIDQKASQALESIAFMRTEQVDKILAVRRRCLEFAAQRNVDAVRVEQTLKVASQYNV
eukprot:TRINITY_DN15030_c0_g1_i2.p1 TRINITY_DN15030_c0_g1~~TRINITY_DN15030_c0_g1_i2.p1  ORF type:complete len:674 (+),score=52.99 TRINITY_DN15030_c0_g1_i2:58-2022(+)